MTTPTTPYTGPGHDLQLTDRDTPCSSKHIEAPCSLQHIDYSTICSGHASPRTDGSYHLQSHVLIRPCAQQGHIPIQAPCLHQSYFGARRRGSHILRDDGDRRKRHYFHSFRIFQPQPSRGKKRRILTRSKPHTAENTSSRKANTTLNRRITNWFLLVPAGSGSYPQIRLSAVPDSCWFRVLSSDQTSCSPWSLLVPGPILKSDFLQSLIPAGSGSYPQIRSPQSSDLPVPGSGSSLHNKSQQPSDPMGGSHHQAIPRRHPYFQTHNSASYGKDARFSSGTQHFPPGFTTWTNSKDMRTPTTLLPLFSATNPDIPLKEIKAFYPLQTPGETQDPCLSKSPRLHPSTSCKKQKFPVKESKIRQSTRKSSCARALVPRSLQVLKDKSTGPPREVASTPQQRSPFLQGPVTGLRTLYPADESSPSPSNPTSLGETYMSYKTGKQILLSTEIQDQGPESYKITFEQVQNLEVLIKTPVYHLEK
ncbi:hypothetical protein HID58_070866 [Brassica napus]|uniref:Uncharacterized protein n=1 Tax=Brassica napus TaxID=3708 RepID=A0ABQ7Z013_BRANA|nr:hypothetical protein HID58_070866 [Brassica napus]